ncbi:hypothetical protein K435DRAFT_855809 [Dendrothele bispora CBS 962.96]|uniref:Uncharacterized protein n=1 Tax=Dendrothele bispora (strain CBS 962.96) TaxID=1314807 RepID=A0A4S8MBB8_DENBC|nr:hypothetical protein K435DRAFT_855809 [Dendrothele bispora CBS 962.96]
MTNYYGPPKTFTRKVSRLLYDTFGWSDVNKPKVVLETKYPIYDSVRVFVDLNTILKVFVPQVDSNDRSDQEYYYDNFLSGLDLVSVSSPSSILPPVLLRYDFPVVPPHESQRKSGLPPPPIQPPGMSKSPPVNYVYSTPVNVKVDYRRLNGDLVDCSVRPRPRFGLQSFSDMTSRYVYPTEVNVRVDYRGLNGDLVYCSVRSRPCFGVQSFSDMTFRYVHPTPVSVRVDYRRLNGDLVYCSVRPRPCFGVQSFSDTTSQYIYPTAVNVRVDYRRLNGDLVYCSVRSRPCVGVQSFSDVTRRALFCQA